MKKSLLVARPLAPRILGRVTAFRRAVFTLGLCAAVLGSVAVTAPAHAAPILIAPNLRAAILERQFSQLLLPELSGELTTTVRFGPPNTDGLALLRLICTVKNTGQRDSGPFVAVVNGQYNTGETFSQSFTMSIPAGGSLSVELPAGFAFGGSSLAWATCTVDAGRAVPEFNENNNVTVLNLQPAAKHP